MGFDRVVGHPAAHRPGRDLFAPAVLAETRRTLPVPTSAQRSIYEVRIGTRTPLSSPHCKQGTAPDDLSAVGQTRSPHHDRLTPWSHRLTRPRLHCDKGCALAKPNAGPSSPVCTSATHEAFAYVDGGSATIWGFAIYQASNQTYRDSILPSGLPAGALDCACGNSSRTSASSSNVG
jgi:hypothetical protein